LAAVWLGIMCLAVVAVGHRLLKERADARLFMGLALGTAATLVQMLAMSNATNMRAIHILLDCAAVLAIGGAVVDVEVREPSETPSRRMTTAAEAD
jgi:hypothetical protein